MNMLEKYTNQLKEWVLNDLIFTAIIIILVAVAAFGLGRWSILESTNTTNERPVLVPVEVPVENQAAAVTSRPAPSAPANTQTTGNFVASVNGTKFHALTCPGAKQISEQNKIYFQTEQEARAAGYSAASNCSF